MVSTSLLLVVAAAAAAVAAGDGFDTAYHINTSATGRDFFGMGGLSGGGATSRLFPSYDEKTQKEILDYLFLPNFGASLHLLKVEIGGDAQSTDGTEPSHQHTPSDLNCERGYEWMLLTEAKKRNPNILTYGLSWAWPGWIDGGDHNNSPWNEPSLPANYTVQWLKCARDHYDIDVDYIGSWNERPYNADYLKLLRKTLDAEGFASTQIVAPDSNWDIAKEMLVDPELKEAVAVVGAHYPGMQSTPQARSLGNMLISSEDDSTYADNVGAGCWVRVCNRNYVEGLMSGTINWNLLASYTAGLPWYGTSFMWADQPWSGHYDVQSEIWAAAHTTQFTWPGMSLLTRASDAGEGGSGSGMLSQGGSYVSYVDVDRGVWSMVVEKISFERSKCVRPALSPYNTSAETANFTISSSFLRRPTQLAVWRSQLAYDGETDVLFERQADIDWSPGSPTFSLDIPTDSVITVSTITAGPRKGGFEQPPPPRSPFPVPYSDDFDAYDLHQEASYFADQAGVLEVLEAQDEAHGRAMRQMVPEKPICWGGDFTPVSLFGVDTWTDISVQVDFMFEDGQSANGTAMLGARWTGGVDMQGLHVAVGLDGSWALYYSTKDAAAVNGPKNAAASGSTGIQMQTAHWYTLALSVTGSSANATLDGKPLFVGQDISACGCDYGWAGVAVGAWEPVWFDNWAVLSATDHGSVCATPAAGQPVLVEGCSADKDTQQLWEIVGSQLQLRSDSSLCLATDGSNSLAVAKCDTSARDQSWTFDLSDNSTQLVNAANGFCMDAAGPSSSVGKDVKVQLAPCDASEGQMFAVDEAGKIVNTGFVAPKQCVGPCSPL